MPKRTIPVVPGAEPFPVGFVERQAEWIDMVSQSLAEIAENDVARLPEDQFVNVFLPLFAGDKPLPHKVTIADWIGIAGSPYKAVDIFDVEGKTLFRVPPFFENEAVNPVRGDKDRGTLPLSDVVENAERFAAMHPAQGSAYLNSALAQRLKSLRTGEKLVQHILTWNTILARYNRPPLIDPAKAGPSGAAQAAAMSGNAAAPAVPAATDVEGEYEDF